MDKNKFKGILTIIYNNKFGHKNKIGDFKYIDIKDLVNNIKDNTISEIDAKKRLNTLNVIKNSEIKHKRLIPGQKESLNLFEDLSDIILTDKTLMSSKDENKKLKEEKLKEDNKDEYENENDNENENKNENEEKDEIIKILMSSYEDYDDGDDDNDDDEINNRIKKLNNYLDKIFDKSKSFEEQIESLKKIRKSR